MIKTDADKNATLNAIAGAAFGAAGQRLEIELLIDYVCFVLKLMILHFTVLSKIFTFNSFLYFLSDWTEFETLISN
jgi:hypothetical protein